MAVDALPNCRSNSTLVELAHVALSKQFSLQLAIGGYPLPSASFSATSRTSEPYRAPLTPPAKYISL